jgi:plastocyanin
VKVKRALVAFLLILAACSSSSHNSTPPTTIGPVDFRGQKTVDVNANQNLFTPATIIINPGTTVTWHNTDLEAHNVTKANDSQDFGAPFGVQTQKFLPRDSYSFTFKKVGTYDYICTIHNGMNGEVIVKVGKTSVPSSTAVG